MQPTASTWTSLVTSSGHIVLICEISVLWVTLCFKLLEDCPHLEDAQNFIQNLPKTIPGLYDRLLTSIPGARKLEARQALQWMAVSERPLYLEEIAEAAMFELPRSSIPVLRLSNSFEIAKICAGLVSLVPTLEHEPYRKKMIFIDHSLKEYLISGNIGSPEAAFFAIPELEAQKLISYVSLGYLLSAMEDAPLSVMERANFPLLKYVLENWYKHMKAVQRFAPVPETTLDRAVKLLDAIYARRGNSELDRPMSKGPEGPEALYLDDSNFPPPLYYASRLGLVDVVQQLLLRGDEHQDNGGYLGTPLQAAAYGGHWPVIQTLVEKDVDVNTVSGFYGTALQAASYNGQYDASGVLLTCGADVNSLSGHYGTPLQAAAYGGHAELMDLLCLCRANINTKGGFYGSALVAAIQGGHEDVVIMLIKNGASVNADGNTEIPNALYGASAKGYRAVVAKLLAYGADPNKDGGFGRSALEAAIQGGYSDVVELLTQKMATLNRASSMGLDLGGLALHMGAQGGHRNLVQQLLRRRSVNVDYQDRDGLSPLVIAVSRGHEAVVRLLLEKGVDRTLTDKEGLTALMMAVIRGHQGLVVLLLDYGLLLENGAGVNARNNYGKTPLMLAVEEGHEAIVYLLLQHGATIAAPDPSERTPIDVAISKGYQIIEKLLDFGDSGTAIADREEFWKTFSRIPMDLEKQNCPSSSLTLPG